MKYLCLTVGIICYCVSFYWMFFYDATIGYGWYEDSVNILDRRMFKLVKGDAYNFMYTYLASVAVSVMGTGFIIMGSSYKK